MPDRLVDGDVSDFSLGYGAYNYTLPEGKVYAVNSKTGKVHSGNGAMALDINYGNSLESGNVSLISLLVCLIGCLKVNVNAAENTTKQISLTGISDVKIYTADKQKEIPVVDKSFTVTPDEYCYESSSGAGGKFTVTEETSELNLHSVTFSNVSPANWNSEKSKWEYLRHLYGTS